MGDLLRDGDRSACIEWPGAVNAFIKCLALDQFHRVKILACLLANSELVDGGDVLVPQRCGCAGFAHKTFAGVGASLGAIGFDDL